MIKGGKGGGNTVTGLVYEGKVDLPTYLARQKGYTVEGTVVKYRGKVVANVFKKSGFYKFLQEHGVVWSDYISCKLYPDNCIYVIINNTLFIIEVKHQATAGSVDEKLQTCDFKRKQYIKLLSRLNIEVEYVYILNDWFRHPRYKDVLDYIVSVNCNYYFNYIPLSRLGLPVPHLA